MTIVGCRECQSPSLSSEINIARVLQLHVYFSSELREDLRHHTRKDSREWHWRIADHETLHILGKVVIGDECIAMMKVSTKGVRGRWNSAEAEEREHEDANKEDVYSRSPLSTKTQSQNHQLFTAK